MKVDEFLLQAAADLNDAERGHEFTHFPRSSLLFYFNEAVRIISLYRPQEFSGIKSVRLQVGSQQRAAEFQSVSKILYQCDQYGNPIGAMLIPLQGNFVAMWNKTSCPQRDGQFRLYGYYRTQTSDNTFTVSPPVPPKPPIYVSVVGMVKPVMINDSNLNADIDYENAMPAIMQWILYRALAVDEESTTSPAAAEKHLSNFFELTKIQYSRELIQRLGDLTSPDVIKTINSLRMAGLLGSPV